MLDGSSLFLLSFSFFSDWEVADLLLVDIASLALAYFSVQESISGKLEENLFSRLKRNLEGLRLPFMADIATIGSRLDTSRVAALNLMMNS